MNRQLNSRRSPFGISAAHRRSALISVTCFLLLGTLLPGRILYQKLKIVDSAGSVQKVFHLEVSDPRLVVLVDTIKATQEANASKPVDYYKARWEMELAAIYARDNRRSNPEETSEQVTQASYIVQPVDSLGTSTYSVPDCYMDTDWDEYWKKLQVESTSRVLQYQHSTEHAPAHTRTQLAEIVPGAKSIFWFVVQMSMTVIIFILMLRLQTEPSSLLGGRKAGAAVASMGTVKRLPLHCRQQLSLPADMFVVRRPIKEMLTTQGAWLPAEVMMAVFIAMNAGLF